MQILSDISRKLQEGRARDVQELVQRALDRNIPVKDILEKGLLDGMSIIGTKFKNNEVFVPEVLIAARAMNRGVELLKPYYSESGVESKGRVCIGTVQGDLHDIGKNLVKMMLEGKGFEVLDLGTDVPADSFIKTTVEKECQIICLSALPTTTMSAMAEVVKAAEQSGIRGQVKIMIGGAPVTDEFRIQIGADGYAPDAASAADLALELIKTL